LKKKIKTSLLALILLFLTAVPSFAQKTSYQIGEAEGLLTDGKVKEAFQKAADKFKDWMYEGVPNGYVTKTDGYYLQTFTDGEDLSAAIYVGPDYANYVLRGPVYEQLESVGGLKKLGAPRSDAYEVNGVWYQNFEKGYVTVPKNGKAAFVAGKQVDEKGSETADPDSGSSSASTDGTTDGKTDASLSSPSQMISNVVSDVEEGASRWVPGVVVALLILAAIVILVYWFLKRK
jgi:cobalamin biosynthesis Mg chelatase CobN